MLFHRLAMALGRFSGVFKLRCSHSEKIKAFFYVVLFYALRVLNRDEFGWASGRLALDNGRIVLTGLNTQSSSYIFMEIFLDDCYHFGGHEGEEVAVLDLGASVGMLLPGLAYYGWRPVRYVGVEPMRKNFCELSNNVKEFMKPGSYALVNRALARSGGRKKRFHDWYSLSRSLEFVNLPARGLKTEEVRTISFSGLLKTVNACFKGSRTPILLKLDMEGGEWEAKGGILSFLKKDRRAKYVRAEFHSVDAKRTTGRIAAEFARALEGVFDFKVDKTEVKRAILFSGERRRT